MILSHLTTFDRLPGIQTHGLGNSFVPLSTKRFQFPCSWFVAADPCDGTWQPATVVVKVEFERNEVVCWRDHLRMRTKAFQRLHSFPDSSTIFFHRDVVPWERCEVYDLEGVRLYPESWSDMPVKVPAPKVDFSEYEYVDLSGRKLTAEDFQSVGSGVDSA